ncbi:ROK family transcriptional regulator [Nocardioides sp. Root122]|uniref:ROK family transcriptional regulator n=1 Tax=Nocardioides TaxID=1839 RepID=UPI0007035F50|nr:MULTISPECIES: ROK family protein [Nocardioides]KQV64871.1 ROK family transcriptional regulator [Nocardioides sp. Root122]MCK9823743.1 ROK family protein [Nocardioides cavernae]
MRTGELFDLLRDGRPWTRSQLAEATGLARSTVAARIDTLMRLGLVAPYGGARSTGGRPPTLFALNAGAKLVVGVDVGATHARAALTDLDGQILGETDARLEVAAGPEEVLGWVVQTVRDLFAASDRPIEDLAAIGIGLPGPVEHSTGRPINPPIMPGWDRYDVPGHLQRVYDVPVLVDNDVNIMALGERRAHLRDVDDLVLIKVATGIGAGIVSGGVLQRGARGTAGDLGHVRVPRAADVLCRCGNTGCLEALAAGPALAAAVREQGEDAKTGGDVVDLVRAGNPVAMAVVRQAGRDIGEVVATMTNLINPSVVVIGGQLAGAGEHLLAGIRESVYQRSLPLATEHLRIVTSRAGGEAAVLGASALAIEHVLSPEVVEAASEAMAAAEAQRSL